MSETSVESIRPKIETVVNVLNMAKMLIPSDKAPLLLTAVDKVGRLVQTQEFAEVAAFSADLINVLVDHFAHKVKQQV